MKLVIGPTLGTPALTDAAVLREGTETHVLNAEARMTSEEVAVCLTAIGRTAEAALHRIPGAMYQIQFEITLEEWIRFKRARGSF